MNIYSHTDLRVPMSEFWVHEDWKYQLKEHLKAAHGTKSDVCKRTSYAPSTVQSKPYHQDDIGKTRSTGLHNIYRELNLKVLYAC